MPSIDMMSLLKKARIPFDGPNSRGWITMLCPSCGKDRLGWNVDSEVFSCWYCRGMPLKDTLMKLTRSSYRAVCDLLTQHTSKKAVVRHAVAEDRVGPSTLWWPDGIGDIGLVHAKYLKARGLDPDEIINQWKIRGTTGLSEPLYAHRIFAPLILSGEEVSWQGRSILKNCDPKLRYVTCDLEKEVVPCKSVVYGMDNVTNDEAIVVEGLFDVWKGGPGVVHTYGTAWTQKQLRFLSSLKRCAIAYDNEPIAQAQALSLAEALSGLGVKTMIVTFSADEAKDFGERSVDEARSIVAEVFDNLRK